MRCLPALTAASLFLSLSRTASAQKEPPLKLQSGLKIERSVKLAPGNYALTEAPGGRIHVTGQNLVLDFAGVVLQGGTRKGVGLHLVGAKNVTIKNLTVQGCLWGIVLEKCEGVKLIQCNASLNGTLPPGTVIDESGTKPEDEWGGGILLRDSTKCLVQKCTARYQWDGMDVIRSTGNVIETSDFSYNGNWGVHFWASSQNTFRSNKAIWCTTGAGMLYQALSGWQTYDAQAVAIDHDSNENLIEGNDLRFGGDGIFIRANEGPVTPGTVVPPKNASNRNILRNNDCSFSPNNAIEVDFVDDTIIEGNNCSNSNYGMWLGYSRRSQVRGNILVNCTRHAVEIENGQDGVFERNVFGFDTPRPEGQLVYLRQNGRDKTPSGGYSFRDNLFYGTDRGVLLKATGAKLLRNTLISATQNKGVLGSGDALSPLAEADSSVQFEVKPPTPLLKPRAKSIAVKPGQWVTLRVVRSKLSLTPPVVEADGAPLWVRAFTPNTVTFQIPEEFWDRPAPSLVELRVCGGAALSEPVTLQIEQNHLLPRIDAVTPNPALQNDKILIVGQNLDGGRILLNGLPAEVIQATDSLITLRPPAGLMKSTGFNLVWERGQGAERVHTPPITFMVSPSPSVLPPPKK